MVMPKDEAYKQLIRRVNELNESLDEIISEFEETNESYYAYRGIGRCNFHLREDIYPNLFQYLYHFKLDEFECEFDTSIKPLFKDIIPKIILLKNMFGDHDTNVWKHFLYLPKISANDFMCCSYENLNKLPRLSKRHIPKRDNEYIETVIMQSSMIPTYILDDPEMRRLLFINHGHENHYTESYYELCPYDGKFKSRRSYKTFEIIRLLYLDEFDIICYKKFVLTEEVHESAKDIVVKVKKMLQDGPHKSLIRKYTFRNSKYVDKFAGLNIHELM